MYKTCFLYDLYIMCVENKKLWAAKSHSIFKRFNKRPFRILTMMKWILDGTENVWFTAAEFNTISICVEFINTIEMTLGQRI